MDDRIEQFAKQLEEQRLWLKEEYRKAKIEKDEKRVNELLCRINFFAREVEQFNKER